MYIYIVVSPSTLYTSWNENVYSVMFCYVITLIILRPYTAYSG